MPYFVISGYPDCPLFAHAIYVAQYLEDHLPDFSFKKIEMTKKEWPKYLIDINKENTWFVYKSPLIWKEINLWGGKKYLLGGLGEFWEYCYCYYGFESIIPKMELLKLVQSNLKFFQDDQEQSVVKYENNRIISILGATNYTTGYLMKELLEIPNLKKEQGIIFRLYDNLAHDKQKYKIMEDFADYINELNYYGKRDIVDIVSSKKEAVEDCDLLIIIEDLRQRPDERQETWLERCFAKMNFLSDTINCSMNRKLRVILNNYGPICFLATCLVECCTIIKPSNIIAITSDEGLPFISVVSEKTGVAVHRITAPPVWGFVGINKFVDIRHMVFKADVYRPNQRSLTAPRGSTLPLGTIKSELRLISYLIPNDEEIGEAVVELKQKICDELKRPGSLGKLRGLISFLKLWYADERTDDIISLGVCSNGSFGIGPGIVFSQPVMLNEKNKWVPLPKFPLINETTKTKIRECLFSAQEVLKIFGLYKYYCESGSNVNICLNPDCPMALNYCKAEGDDCSNPDCPMNIRYKPSSSSSISSSSSSNVSQS